MTIDLSPETEARLSEYAAMRGLNMTDCVRVVVEKEIFAPSVYEKESFPEAEREYIAQAVSEAIASQKGKPFHSLSEVAAEIRAKYKFPMQEIDEEKGSAA